MSEDTLGPEIRHAIKHRRPVPAYLIPPGEGPIRVNRLLAAVAGVKAAHEAVQIVPVQGVAQSLDYLSGRASPGCTHGFLLGTACLAILIVRLQISLYHRPVLCSPDAECMEVAWRFRCSRFSRPDDARTRNTIESIAGHHGE